LTEINHINEEVISMLTDEGEEDFKEALERSNRAIEIAVDEHMDSNFKAILVYNRACCYQ